MYEHQSQGHKTGSWTKILKVTGVNDIYDLPESYLKAFLKDGRITESSIISCDQPFQHLPPSRGLTATCFYRLQALKILSIQDTLVLPVDPKSTPRVFRVLILQLVNSFAEEFLKREAERGV